MGAVVCDTILQVTDVPRYLPVRALQVFYILDTAVADYLLLLRSLALARLQHILPAFLPLTLVVFHPPTGCDHDVL